MFGLNNKIHFSLANVDNSGRFKRKMVKNHRFCSFTATNKLVNEAANDSARVSGQDRKKLPPLGTNPIAGFGGFHSARKLREKRKYLLANRIFMLLLPMVYLLFLCWPGTWGGIYLDFSQYPLGYLCLPSDQASM